MEIPNKGSLTEISFVEILKDASFSRLTGMIRLETGVTIKVVYLQQGNIAFASSNEKGDRLTEVLKRAGKLTPEQIDHAQERLKPNVSLGKTLVELGFISAKDLLWGAKMQVEGILYQLLFWNSGSYQVIEGPLPREIVSLGLPIPSIIFEGIRQTQDRDWVLLHIGSPEALYEKTPAFEEKNAEFNLPVDGIARQMDGTRTLQEIAAATRMDTFELCKITAAMQVLDLVRPVPVKQHQIPPVPEEYTVDELNQVSAQSQGEEVSLGQVLQIPTVEELTVQKENQPELESAPVNEPPANADQESSIEEKPAPPEEPALFEEPVKEEQEPFFESVVERPAEDNRLRDYPGPLSADTEEEPAPKSKKLLIALIAILIAGGVGFYFYWNICCSDRPAPQASAPMEEPSSQPPAEPQAEPPAELEVPPETEQDQTIRPTSEEQLADAPKTQQAPPSEEKAQQSPLELARTGRLREAAVQWRSQLAQRRNRLTIQIEIACQESTVMGAIDTFDDPSNVYVVPITFKGQSCYRVLYGVFPNAATAETERVKLPAEFLTQASPPQIIEISKVVR